MVILRSANTSNMETTFSSIEGSWSGSYGYGGGRLPVEFDARFNVSQNGVDFTGLISDNGPLGDAHITGRQMGRTITLTKFYIAPVTDAVTNKVLYSGELSDDGNTIIGRWKLGAFTSGPWQIYRNNPFNYAPTPT